MSLAMLKTNQLTRIEKDSLGKIEVDTTRYWGAQTQRSLELFKIGQEVMPIAIIKALALIKKAAALVNAELGDLDQISSNLICQAADQILKDQLSEHFPLKVWQTGSGTQSNMNVNEVIAHVANKSFASDASSNAAHKIHPNDHVNLSQSTNDSFSSAMHIAVITETTEKLLPALSQLEAVLLEKERAFAHLIKVGRTHLMDAVPMTLGQEISGYRAQVQQNLARIKHSLLNVQALAQGGTAVGTGLNSRPEFASKMAQTLSKLSGYDFVSADNKFEAMAAHDALVFAHGALKTLACSLIKIANDIRWLSSGPRCGLQELLLPENEPGSSIMPGKINPTQCEALLMVCYQVLGNDTTISIAGASGNFELNVAKPVIAFAYLQSLTLLSDSIKSFTLHCLDGIKPNEEVLAQNLENTLMLVTALTPHIGYDQSSLIAKTAYRDKKSLREVALGLGILTEAQYDLWVQPKLMTSPRSKDSVKTVAP